MENSCVSIKIDGLLLPVKRLFSRSFAVAHSSRKVAKKIIEVGLAPLCDLAALREIKIILQPPA